MFKTLTVQFDGIFSAYEEFLVSVKQHFSPNKKNVTLIYEYKNGWAKIFLAKYPNNPEMWEARVGLVNWPSLEVLNGNGVKQETSRELSIKDVLEVLERLKNFQVD